MTSAAPEAVVTAAATGMPGEALGGAADVAPLSYVYAKRAMDLIVSAVLLILTLPLFLIISVAIVIDSGWPVFYRQDRGGARPIRTGTTVRWTERPFRIFKFRTMYRGADRDLVHERFTESFVRGELVPDPGNDAWCALAEDARVTRVGRLLRVTSLDELPQLLNVLAGRMSMVGPRPVPMYEVALYNARDRARLAGLPGITGAWQVEGRGRVNFEEMVRMDVEYLHRHSLWLDIVLLARTAPAVLRQTGAK